MRSDQLGKQFQKAFVVLVPARVNDYDQFPKVGKTSRPSGRACRGQLRVLDQPRSPSATGSKGEHAGFQGRASFDWGNLVDGGGCCKSKFCFRAAAANYGLEFRCPRGPATCDGDIPDQSGRFADNRAGDTCGIPRGEAISEDVGSRYVSNEAVRG